MSLRIGSLFSGYGGLDVGISQVLDAETVWHSEIDAAPLQILARHWPSVPNLGDITAVDWATVPPVDVLCGGFPCQDVSLAGLRRGLKPGTRSGLWSHFAAAIDALRPEFVVIENVRGLLSAEAHSDVESDPWDLGGPERVDRPALRALGAVLGDLADLGYDAEWIGLRAADAGAPHFRFRVFVLARPAADPGDQRRGAGSPAHDDDGPVAHRDEPDRRAAPHTDGRGRGPHVAELRAGEPDTRGRAAADPNDDAARDGRGRGDQAGGGTEPAQRGRLAADAVSDGRERRGDAEDLAQAVREARDEDGRAANPGRHAADDRGAASRDWGPYAPAIRRWEAVLGRVAPAPTDSGRLAPEFVEWMMGLDAGHVTAVGLTRAQQLKALGNGVVPQQAALALRTLLGLAA